MKAHIHSLQAIHLFFDPAQMFDYNPCNIHYDCIKTHFNF